MCEGIAHFVYESSRHIRVFTGEFRISPLDIARNLADDLEISDHCILNLLYNLESCLIQIGSVTIYPLNGFQDVPKLVTQTGGRQYSSYRYCLILYLLTETAGKGVRGKHVHLDTEQLPQLVADRPNIEERHVSLGIDQKIKITALVILAMQHRAEHPGIPCAVACDDTSDFGPVPFQGLRWFHAINIPKIIRTTVFAIHGTGFRQSLPG